MHFAIVLYNDLLAFNVQEFMKQIWWLLKTQTVVISPSPDLNLVQN